MMFIIEIYYEFNIHSRESSFAILDFIRLVYVKYGYLSKI
jgi:hypothetical protein